MSGILPHLIIRCRRRRAARDVLERVGVHQPELQPALRRGHALGVGLDRNSDQRRAVRGLNRSWGRRHPQSGGRKDASGTCCVCSNGKDQKGLVLAYPPRQIEREQGTAPSGLTSGVPVLK
jgi:hypothetical protein